jgi:hypothetical protein
MARRTQRLQILWLVQATLPHRYHVINIILLELTGKQTATVWIGTLPPLSLCDLPTLGLGAWLAGGGRFGVSVLAFLRVLQFLLEVGENTDALAQGLY